MAARQQGVYAGILHAFHPAASLTLHQKQRSPLLNLLYDIVLIPKFKKAKTNMPMSERLKASLTVMHGRSYRFERRPADGRDFLSGVDRQGA
jgi:hypothetical protein